MSFLKKMLGRGGRSDPGTTTPANSDPGTTTPGKSDQVDTTPAMSKLYWAASDGNLPLVTDLVASGGDVNYVNTGHYNRTPLIEAIVCRHHPVSEFLARLDSVDISLVSTHGATALHYACLYGGSAELLQILLGRSSDRLLNIRDKGNASAVVFAVCFNHIPALQMMARLDRVTTWDMGELVSEARKSNEDRKKYGSSRLTDDQLVTMLGLLSSLDMERKERAEQVALRQRREVEERQKEEEKKRAREQREISDKLKREHLEDEKKRKTKKQSEEAKECYIDESSFASLCKRSSVDEVSPYLRYNPDLLNCLSGQPLREAVLGRNNKVVNMLLGMEGILPNLPTSSGLTALHLATTNDDPVIIQRLLSHPGIDANPKNQSGLTPVKMATIRGKTQALKVLLESPRVESDMVDEEGNDLEDLLRATHLGELKISSGLKLLEAAKNRRNTSDRKKTVIFVVNSKYSAKEFKDLPGTREDLKLAKKIFEERNYVIHVLENCSDILEDVCEYIEKTEGFEESARDVLQFVFMGHGVHKKIVQKCKNSNYQEGEIGDCLVNVDGTFCGELQLALNIARGVSEHTKLCMIYDMCRVQTRAPEEEDPIVIEIDTFDLKEEYQNIGADERTVKIFSAKLGQKAVDANSFLNQICREITTVAPYGIKFGQMKNEKFRSDNQQPKIECDVFDWGDEFWPLS